MKELKFRAKRRSFNQWVYFDLLKEVNSNEQPSEFLQYQLDLGTIGQYAGLKDRNGKEIYFGDILATSNEIKENEWTEYDIWDKEENGYTVVLEKEDELGVTYSNWHVENDFIAEENRFEKNSIYSLAFVEVIGNIHSNPELL